MITKRLIRRHKQRNRISSLRKHLAEKPHGDVVPGLLVSLTSFPARIKTTWIAIESILKQDTRPEHLSLCLSENEFGRSYRLPEEIRTQQSNGIEIIWTSESLRSYGKLLPALEKYPQAKILTIDDDILYRDDLVHSLVAANDLEPKAIVGSRGYFIKKDSGKNLLPYSQWDIIDQPTDSDRCFLTGVGGILYPPDSLPVGLAQNRDIFHNLCPNADDIWLWALSIYNNSKRICLGDHDLEEIKRLFKTPRLSRLNVKRGGNDNQLEAVVAYFREHFNKDLLEQSCVN